MSTWKPVTAPAGVGPTGPTGAAGGSGYSVLAYDGYSISALGTFDIGGNFSANLGFDTFDSVGTYNISVTWAISVDPPTTATPGDLIQVIMREEVTTVGTYAISSSITTDSSGVFPNSITTSGLIRVASPASKRLLLTFNLCTLSSTTTYCAYLLSYVIQRVE
jgi:hypothetical protein